MERLLNELNSLLKMLDHETVSPDTADKMASVRNILDSLQQSGTLERITQSTNLHCAIVTHTATITNDKCIF